MSSSSIVSLPTDRPDFHAFEVSGRISRPDIERMANQLKQAFKLHETVDVLVMITRWEGIDFEAFFDANSLSAQFQANRHVRKYAVVGAPGWAEVMINLFAPLTPVHEKTFALSDADNAWLWVTQ